MTHSNARIRLLAFLGSVSVRLEAASADIARSVTRDFGGVSLSFVDGYWAPDGNNATGPYDADNLSAEKTLRIELLVYPEDEAAAIACVKAACQTANAIHGLGAVYLHIETCPARAFHADISSDGPASA